MNYYLFIKWLTWIISGITIWVLYEIANHFHFFDKENIGRTFYRWDLNE